MDHNPDGYIRFAHSTAGKTLFSWCGLSVPPILSRHNPTLSQEKTSILLNTSLHNDVFSTIFNDCLLSHDTNGASKVDALIFDASDCSQPKELAQVHQFFKSQLKRLKPNGAILLVGLDVNLATSVLQAATQRALTGIVKSLAKEVGRIGVNANLIYVPKVTACHIAASSRFFVSNKSAYVSGQIVTATDSLFDLSDWEQPLSGQTALVTGASRGIGAAIAKTLTDEGATVIGLDVPQAKDALEKHMAAIGGQSLLVDITADNAAELIVQSLKQPLDIVVHNAGVTRDKTIKRMTDDQWELVMSINLEAVANINDYLIANNQLTKQGRIVCVSSISGIAGNVGQTNYAASKAGIIGLVNATAAQLALQSSSVTINAVAPGFIETEMTAKIPFVTRYLGRRMCSFSQGGLPSDVAQAISFLASPNTQSITGNTLRVCGQNFIGA